MDLLDIPEIEPTVLEPDFFDAETELDHGVVVEESSQHTLIIGQPSPAELLDKIMPAGVDDEGTQLKYDDELCEFDEFLVLVNGSENTKTDRVNKEEAGSKTKPEDKEGEVTTEDEDEADGGGGSKKEASPEPEANGNGTNANESGSSMSAPSSPAGSKVSSTSASAVVHLVSLPNLPKMTTERKSKRISKDSEEEQEEGSETIPTPPRMTRGRLNVPSDNKSKRKLDTSDVKKTRTTRSGRQSRKSSRYGNEDDDESADANDSEESETLFEPVKKKSKMTVKSKYRIDEDGSVYFIDPEGNDTLLELKEAKVHLVRMKDPTLVEEDDAESPILLEVCIDNFRSAKEAVKGGAKRIELCSSLVDGGLTPSTGFLQLVKENVGDTLVFVMIRPRGGDFVYSEDEIDIMSRDISYYKQMGADGFVFGVLTKDCEVDEENSKLLIQMAYPLPCTFHRAFDKVHSPMSGLETLIKLGFKRILTSGQAPTAHSGIPMLKRLVAAAKERIIIMAGCGINDKNVGEIVKKTGIVEVHGSASKEVASLMCAPGTSKPKSRKRGSKASQSDIKMGALDDTVIKVTDSTIVSQMIMKASRAVKK